LNQTSELVGWVYLFSTSCTKISVLLFYRRLAKGTYDKRFKIAVWVAIFIVVAYTIITAVLLGHACTPLQSLWRQFDPTYTAAYHCESNHLQESGSLVSGILSVVTDLYSVMLPAMLLLRTRISKRQKIGLIIIFGLGYL
jgi:drug/metabolite transporter (DMT)-like permease